MKVAIIYYNFFDAEGETRKIGGVETYLLYLSKIIIDRGDEPILLQPAVKYYEKKIDGLKVIGVPPSRLRIRKNTRKDLYEKAFSLVGEEKGIIIFGADHVSVRTKYPRAVSIQHGISWDLPGRFMRGRIGKVLPFLPDSICKKYVTYRSRKYFNNCSNRVCVDYNFINWLRTQIAGSVCGRAWVIPNFVVTPCDFTANLKRHKEKPIKIIFARRFIEYRGTRLMIEATLRLLEKFKDIEISFAGEGPDQELILNAFPGESRVEVFKYYPEETLQIHSRFHISVVPSLGSEGTSLALAEAMAAGCAVVATNVGGMTNMIINGYNGLLVNPNVDDVVMAVSDLISDDSTRTLIGQRAAATAAYAFSFGRWKSAWTQVLNQI